MWKLQTKRNDKGLNRSNKLKRDHNMLRVTLDLNNTKVNTMAFSDVVSDQILVKLSTPSKRT